MTKLAPEPTFIRVGRRDAQDSGGFDHRTGELRPGFAITEKDVVVDVGCGNGNESLFCAERGAAVIFVDIDAGAVETTANRLAGLGARKLTSLVSDCDPLPLPSRGASKIIAAEVIEHVDDPSRFLRELVRVGKPGAHYLLTAPDPRAEHLQKGLAPDGHFEKPNHIRIIERDAFETMTADAGLTVERHGYYGFHWAIWWMFFWICNVDLASPLHPLLESWSDTWEALLDAPGAAEVRRDLNELLPKSQYIVARKPESVLLSLPLVATARELLQSVKLYLWPPEFNFPSRAGKKDKPEIIAEEPVNTMMTGLQDAAQSGWFNIDRQELFDGFRVTAEDVVLDVGCGTGSYSALCGGWGAHVIFTDMNPGNVASTEERLKQTAARGVTPIIADTTALPLDDASVSRIVSTEMIEHVADPAALLRELARVGKPGALYLLSVPDPVHEGLQRRLAPASYFQKREPGVGKIRGLWGGAQHTIGRDEFERLVADAGLVVEQHRYSGFFWALWFTFFWGCDVDFPGTGHPVLESWTRTWKMVLDHPDGRRVKDRLDAFMPKSQIIIARKPS